MRSFVEAESTPQAGGVRIRRYNPTALWLGLVATTTAAMGAAVVLLGAATRVELAIVALLAWAVSNLSMVWIFAGHQRKGVRANNGAVTLLTMGDEARATEMLRGAVSGFFPRDVVAMSLYNLGIVAIRARDTASAAKLFRASVDAASGIRFKSAPALYSGLSRAQLAFTLAVMGELDAADACIAQTDMTTVSPLAIAFGVRARATLALRRGRFEDVVAMLDAERALLRNALSLHDAILVEAMRAHALSRTANAYRAAAHASGPTYADDLARAYVRSMLPELEPMLVS
jgi:hypothetical protein